MTDDPIIERIESFRCRRGQLLAERRNRGYTPNRASSGALVARFCPVMRAWNGGARSRYGGDAASGPGVDGLYSARDLIS